MKTQRNNKGFTLVEIMIVVAIIGLLAAIAIPNFVKARTTAQTNACIANLKQMQGSIEQWALENKKGPDSAVTTDNIKAYLSNSKIPNCPAGGTYSVDWVTNAPACTITGHSLTNL